MSNFDNVLSDATLCNSLFTITLGDFNARSSVCRTRDKTTIEGTQLESLASVYGFHQLITTHWPTTTNFFLYWFNIYWSTKYKSDSGVHPSLHSNRHHQITYWKLNLNIEYSPPYERLVWDYNRANVGGINEHTFKHNIQDCVNPLCSCSSEIESFSHFFLHYHHFTNIRATLLNDLQLVDRNIQAFQTMN